MKSFSKWTIAEVEETFALNPCKQLESLNQWLNAPAPLAPDQEELLADLREKLLDHVWDWNESELKGKFIFPLLAASSIITFVITFVYLP